MRVLDEVAEAIRRTRAPYQHPPLAPVELDQQFDRPPTAREWDAIRRHLACPLPLAEFVQGHWFLPDGFATIWDLVDFAARFHPEWEPPAERTEAAWREAQIFAGVKMELIDALDVEPELVTRKARIMLDLGAE